MLCFICSEKKLPNRQEVSKFYKNDNLELFLYFVSLLKNLIVKNTYIVALV